MAFEVFGGFEKQLVYYEDLSRTHPDIYGILKTNQYISSIGYEAKMASISSKMYSMADIEAQKEQNMLSEYFGITIPKVNTYNVDFGRELIDAINTSLQFKEVYERYITRIIGPGNGKHQAKITDATLFKEYFSKEIYEIGNETLDKISQKSVDYTLDQLIDIIFSKENINLALERTFFIDLKNSGDWDRNDKTKGDMAFYQELERKENEMKKNTFLQEVYKLYKLDELKNKVLESIKSEQQLNNIFKKNKTDAKVDIQKIMKESTYQHGTLAEIIGEKAVNLALSKMKDGKNYKIISGSKVVGGSGGKADIVATLGFGLDRVLDIVEKTYDSRVERVNAYKEIGQRLANIKDGFIVYTNVKDYTLGSSFGGFKSGSEMSLGSLRGVLKNTPGGSEKIIGEIMNTMSGAVLEDDIDRIENELCEKMAYFLFDDVTTIGKDTKASAHAIHLMLLDGVYIPLSYLFFLMGRAIEEVGRGGRFSPDKIFDITITPGETKYPSKGEEAEQFNWQPGMWMDQKKIAYNQVKIGAIFLRNFTDMISEVKGG